MNDSTFFRYNSIVDIGVLKTGELISVKKVNDKRFIVLVGNLDKVKEDLSEESIYLNELFPIIFLGDKSFGLNITALSVNEMPRKFVVDDFDEFFVSDILTKNLIKDFNRIVTGEEDTFRFLCETYRRMANEKPSDRLVGYIEGSS